MNDASARLPIERYFLYGEPVQSVEARFLHVEPIRLRSGRHEWTIAPHAHADLHQILLVTTGGGVMRAEAERLPIAHPALLIVPAGAAHAFDFAAGTDGWVVTVADSMAAEVARGDPAIVPLLGRARCVNALDAKAVAGLSAAFEALSREFLWSAPARMRAIEAELIRILVAAARIAEAEGRDAAAAPVEAELIARFQHLVEQRFRSAEPVSAYARRLAVTEDRLLAACQRRFGQPPKMLIQRRILVEAQRWLMYTTMPVGEISHALGFRDAAYFSRFFKRKTGRTPRDFRAGQGGPAAPARP
ncbi:HTH-type transcriptional activator RhaS [Methylobacterium crusticola]|uniref:HTH-type transcriptional activator RhaS n=1 Tax=Methylobacterium crusticola TaxID=1697972 RepID=A0ABQ4R6N0_9HYPH|nr:helix-turn-helix domain-containing protein [Methylobacterium crusticola]GJD53313.1 HTH-type transcriptional activator RhaS [Methylobacterium crusticola]